MRRSRSRSARLAATAVLLVGVGSSAAACSVDDDPAASGDDTTTTTDPPAGTGGDQGEFCDRIAALGESTPDDVAATADALRDVAAVAPDEVREPLETLAGIWDSLGSVAPDSSEALDVMSSPEVARASAEVSTYLAEECGIETLDQAAAGPSAAEPAPSTTGPPPELSGDDVDAAIDAAGAGTRWGPKVNTGVAANGRAIVQLDESGTVQDALDACAALAAELGAPVRVLIGTGRSATSDADGSCALD